MIQNLPTEEDLEATGIDFLFRAMRDAIGVAAGESDFDELDREFRSDEEDHTPGGSETSSLAKKFMAGSRRELALCASFVHMGAEFLLKARISGVSPYLLLDSRQSWSKSKSPFFDEMRTIDANLLPQVFNTVCASTLDDQFIKTLKRIRERRNAIVHAASVRSVPTIEGLVRDVLEIAAHLIGEGSWPRIMRECSHVSPFVEVDHHGMISSGLLYDFDFLLQVLDPGEAERHLGFPSGAERYYCPCCRLGDVAPDIKVAFLRADSEVPQIHCIACGEDFSVRVVSCTCGGNILDEDGTCLSCGEGG